MTKRTLITSEIRNGIWEGAFSGEAGDGLTVTVQHLTDTLPDVTCDYDAARNTWHVKAPIPAAMINEGMQTFMVTDENGTLLTHFSLIAGEALSHDLRAELGLLRAELDILKKAFRKHAAES